MCPRVAVSTGPVKISPSGMFSWPLDVSPETTCDAEMDVRPLGLDVNLAPRLDPRDETLLHPSHLLRGYRVLLVEITGGEEKGFVLREAHAGVHRIGLRREERQVPSSFTRGRAVEERGRHVSVGLRAGHVRGRVQVRKGSRVRLTEDPERHVDVLVEPAVGLHHVLQLMPLRRQR